MKHNTTLSTGLLLIILLAALLAGCSPKTEAPLYALASYDANGDGEFDSAMPGEEAPAIYQVLVKGDEVTMGRLTDPTEYIPKWFLLSPDRTRLAFTTEAIPEIGELLYIKDLRTTKPPEQVLGDTFRVEGISWSRDGKNLTAVITDSAGQKQVLYVTPDGTVERAGDLQLYVENEIQDYSPLVSPDISKRLWPYGVEGGYHYTITGPLDDPKDSQNLLTEYPLNFVAWSPDSQQILMFDSASGNLGEFGALPEAHGALYTINSDGSELQGRTAAGAATNIAAWSPDGRSIAYLSILEDTNQDGEADTRSQEPLLFLLQENGTARRIALGDAYRFQWGIDW